MTVPFREQLQQLAFLTIFMTGSLFFCQPDLARAADSAAVRQAEQNIAALKKESEQLLKSNQVPAALELMHKAINIYMELGDKRIEISDYSTISKFFYTTGSMIMTMNDNIFMARIFLETGIEEDLAHGMKKEAGAKYFSLALSELRENPRENKLQYGHKALELYQQANEPKQAGQTRSWLCVWSSLTREFARTEQLCRKAQENSLTVGVDPAASRAFHHPLIQAARRQQTSTPELIKSSMPVLYKIYEKAGP